MGELHALLVGNGLPATTEVSIRVVEPAPDGSQHSTTFVIARVQVVHQLHARAAGQSQEFALEILAVKSAPKPVASPSGWTTQPG
jgi:hypothetical protein